MNERIHSFIKIYLSHLIRKGLMFLVHDVSWLLNRGSLRVQALSLQAVSLLFCLFTQVNLLIDGSVEGQYVTQPINLIEE